MPSSGCSALQVAQKGWFYSEPRKFWILGSLDSVVSRRNLGTSVLAGSLGGTVNPLNRSRAGLWWGLSEYSLLFSADVRL